MQSTQKRLNHFGENRPSVCVSVRYEKCPKYGNNRTRWLPCSELAKLWPKRSPPACLTQKRGPHFPTETSLELEEWRRPICRITAKCIYITLTQSRSSNSPESLTSSHLSFSLNSSSKSQEQELVLASDTNCAAVVNHKCIFWANNACLSVYTGWCLN